MSVSRLSRVRKRFLFSSNEKLIDIKLLRLKDLVVL